MSRLLVGLLVGLLAGAGGYWGLEQHRQGLDPCRGRCGEGTRCEGRRCLAVVPPRATRPKKKKRRRKGRRRRRPAPAPGETQRKRPGAAQLRALSRGPALGQVDYVELGKGGVAGGRELSEQEVTARVRRLDPRVIACIGRAGRGYDLSGAVARVGFRIERSGRVKKVRITAPRLLMEAGLAACLGPLFRGLTFPPSSRALIMTYPYTLD